AASYTSITDIARAYLEGTTAELFGDLTVTATSASVIGGVTVGVAGGKDFSLAGSVSINLITDTIDAHIGLLAGDDPRNTTGNTSRVTTPGKVTVSATDTSTLVAAAGGVSVSSTGTSVGAAVSYNLVQNTIVAYVDHTPVTDGTGNVTSLEVS